MYSLFPLDDNIHNNKLLNDLTEYVKYIYSYQTGVIISAINYIKIFELQNTIEIR